MRSGSGFSYPVHTIVPQANWQVDIIDGPRNAGGVTWWDVSRKNIDGGGTGWVYFEQAGNCLFKSDVSQPKEQPSSPLTGQSTGPATSDGGKTDVQEQWDTVINQCSIDATMYEYSRHIAGDDLLVLDSPVWYSWLGFVVKMLGLIQDPLADRVLVSVYHSNQDHYAVQVDRFLKQKVLSSERTEISAQRYTTLLRRLDRCGVTG